VLAQLSGRHDLAFRQRYIDPYLVLVSVQAMTAGWLDDDTATRDVCCKSVERRSPIENLAFKSCGALHVPKRDLK
jgi:hypothetical protein